VNYATWDNPFTMFEIMGFGKTDASQSLLLSPGSTALAWGPVVALVAEALGVELDEITEWHELIHADEAFEIDVAFESRPVMRAQAWVANGAVFAVCARGAATA